MINPIQQAKMSSAKNKAATPSNLVVTPVRGAVRGDPTRAKKLAEAAEIRSKRRSLMEAECERRGLRFLPQQAMRSIYEAAGVL